MGDPGTGKSNLLRYAAKICNRSVVTTGVGSTSAGLTVSVVKDGGGDYALEAGALVLADGGTCFIDEFSSIRAADRNTIHEAMEQQTVSIAKAGIVATLNTRATVMAALNPKCSFDDESDLSVNTAIAGPLLSRFDIIMLLLDKLDAGWDSEVCAHVLEINDDSAVKDWFSIEQMKKYVNLVKEAFHPVMTPYSEKLLIKYYTLQRNADMRNAARTTIRLLESLVRIAQAHARLMFRPKVLPMDAMMAIIMIESSMLTASLVKLEDSLTHFPVDPDASCIFYFLFCINAVIDVQQRILSRLDMEPIPENEEYFDYHSLKYDTISRKYVVK